MATQAKVLEYAVEVDRGGRMTIPGGAQFVHAEGWSADHLLLAALVRCSIDSFAYHARRAGHDVVGVGLRARERSRRRGADGRYRFVDDRRRDRRAARRRAPTTRDDLIAKAERDCFVGASLTIKPEYDVARVLTTVEAARARFTALQQPLAFFDGPGGTQVPDSVIDAIATTCARRTRTSAARSRRRGASDALVDHAHDDRGGVPRTRRPTRSRSART